MAGWLNFYCYEGSFFLIIEIKKRNPPAIMVTDGPSLRLGVVIVHWWTYGDKSFPELIQFHYFKFMFGKQSNSEFVSLVLFQTEIIPQTIERIKEKVKHSCVTMMTNSTLLFPYPFVSIPLCQSLSGLFLCLPPSLSSSAPSLPSLCIQ